MSEFDERKVRAIQELSSRLGTLDKARQCVEDGEYAKALELYVNGLKGSIGSRLHDIKLSESLNTLLENYPDAKVPLTKTRDELESALKEKSRSSALIEEWLDLSEALGEPYREVEFIKELKTNDVLDCEHGFTILTITKTNLEKYLRDKRYELIEPHINYLGKTFLTLLVHHESELIFPDKHDRDDYSFEHLQRSSKEGAQIYEACFALNRIVAAEEIAKRVLAVSNDTVAYKRFLKAAKRLESDQQIAFLLELAEKHHSDDVIASLKSELQL